MDKIPIGDGKYDNNIYIGDIEDGADKERLEEKNIDTIINLSGGCADHQIILDYEYIHTPIKDGKNPQNVFERPVRLLNEMIAGMNKKNILVHCAAGVSRSPAVVTAALTRNKSITYNESFDIVKEGRKQANIEPGLKTNVKNYIPELIE